MRTSLIITSYNQPNALALVLEGVLTQTLPIDEIVFGDDGSEPDTPALVQEFEKRAPCPVVFTTQEDAGFRKSKALNNAIRQTHGEHVLFLDGDCIPAPQWAANHLAGLAKADFTVAGYVWFDLERAQKVTPELVAAGQIESTILAEERAQMKSVHRKEQFYRLLRKAKKPRILGGNWAVKRTSLIAVNGFDERFEGFTKEDSDMRNRLRNAGFHGRSLWDHNWVFHCSHDLDPRRNRPGSGRGKPDYEYYRSRENATTCELGLERTAEA